MRERVRRTGRGYSAIPNDALRDESLSIEARGLLALLMSYSDDWTFIKEKLMEVSCCGRDKFERLMKELRDAQYVELVHDRDARGRVQGSTWIIRDHGNRSPEKPGLGEGATEALKNRPPAKPTPGKSTPYKNTNREEYQSKETQTLFSEIEEPQSAQVEDGSPPGFEAFWEAYPPGRKTGKPQALTAWQRIIAGRAKGIPKTDPEAIISAARRYAASRPDPQYVPMPATWLNGARWDQWQADQHDPDRDRYAAIRDRAAAFQPHP